MHGAKRNKKVSSAHDETVCDVYAKRKIEQEAGKTLSGTVTLTYNMPV
jgi:hypothetical protein